jgi:dienelactone hydrolase
MKKFLLPVILCAFGLAAVSCNDKDTAAVYSVVADDTIFDGYTVFYPEDLSAFPKKDKLPVLVMSGPGCVKSAAPFRPFFEEMASHGYLMIACGPLTMGRPRPDGVTMTMTQNTKEDMLAAIDWAFAENERADSPFCGKVDTKHVSVMGQSCGGILCLDIMDDPRITLLTMFNTGLFAAPAGGGGFNMGSVQSEPKEQVFARLRVPIAYFVGGTDMARPNATDDFPYIKNVPAFLAVREIEGDAHGGTFREEKGGAFGEAAAAWLDWNLKGRKAAEKKFLGSDNIFDSDPLWIEYTHNNI